MSRKVDGVLVTGSAGLIGSESVRFYCERGDRVIGVDNDARRYFFGKPASTAWNRRLLERRYRNYRHENVDVRGGRGRAGQDSEVPQAYQRTLMEIAEPEAL